jgi:hypothetical protein
MTQEREKEKEKEVMIQDFRQSRSCTDLTLSSK